MLFSVVDGFHMLAIINMAPTTHIHMAPSLRASPLCVLCVPVALSDDRYKDAMAAACFSRHRLSPATYHC